MLYFKTAMEQLNAPEPIRDIELASEDESASDGS